MGSFAFREAEMQVWCWWQLLVCPHAGGSSFFPVLEGAWASWDPVYSVEGIGLEALQASPSIEILYPDSAFDEKNAVDLKVLLWKDVHDILLSEKNNL